MENLEALLTLASISPEKVSRKNRPTFIAIQNDVLEKIKPEHLNQKLSNFSKKSLEISVVQNIKDLAESLRTGNRGLSDCTFVYAEGTEEMNDYAHRLILSETRNSVLKVTSTKVMDELRMEAGKFYCYYKPSYVNGYA